MTESKYTGVFAFEGDWHQNLRNMSSMRPTLETLRDIFGADGLEFSHRRIGTADELEYYVDKWLSEEPGESYDDYRVGYFAFHGGQGLISPGGGDVSLDDLPDGSTAGHKAAPSTSLVARHWISKPRRSRTFSGPQGLGQLLAQRRVCSTLNWLHSTSCSSTLWPTTTDDPTLPTTTSEAQNGHTSRRSLRNSA